MKKVLIVLLLLLVGAGVAGGYWYYHTMRSVQKNITAGQQERAAIVAKVGTHMELPHDETPTLVTVADVTKLKGQTFFAHAKNGFKVLIYTKAQKAILYDPFFDKIVDVAPVQVGNTKTSRTPSPTVQATVTPRPTSGLKVSVTP